MARNRKYQTTATRFGPALKAMLLCLLIGGSGVGYVWQKGQINELGKQRLKREQRLAELLKQNEKLNTQLNTMRLPWMLEKNIADLKLGLVRPQPAQIWYLPEPGRETVRAGGESQLAAQGARASGMP
jgi:hypothetical protein